MSYTFKFIITDCPTITALPILIISLNTILLPYVFGAPVTNNIGVDVYVGKVRYVKELPLYETEFIVMELPHFNTSVVGIFVLLQATFNDILYLPEVEGTPVYVTVGAPIILDGGPDDESATDPIAPVTYTDPLYQLKAFDGPLLIRY